ncbi:uncharacterized protein ASCRUDRAFT_112144 [Ascoidea rubescens DSM 1968]|uniref:Uncharacterized protein n=1 Tax=Ascoidea rubescens DSM 1968 TaxID=1344418 RepID=A0A1D2VCL4_9ASCO|nr:hypothetical protein ASCRUDRAFT_112144 [Ascoidea rubescens DSM 1968]ODV59381.1 hypothetical protein ASCRUDRAFT_112144 [Ascoidea rubescens DSM 1968]
MCGTSATEQPVLRVLISLHQRSPQCRRIYVTCCAQNCSLLRIACITAEMHQTTAVHMLRQGGSGRKNVTRPDS